MLRTFLVTLVTLLVGLPLSVGAVVVVVRATGMHGEAPLYAVAIIACIVWTLVLFVALWGNAGSRA